MHAFPIDILDCQEALRARYRSQPELAWTTHLAWTEPSGAALADPERGAVRVALAGPELSFAVDESLGGPHDDTVPGELLCAALAACMDSTIRMLAARGRIDVERLTVLATGDLDARGALGAAGIPAGMQSMRLEIQLRVRPGTRLDAARCLIYAAERRSVVLATLRSGVPVEVVLDVA